MDSNREIKNMLSNSMTIFTNSRKNTKERKTIELESEEGIQWAFNILEVCAKRFCWVNGLAGLVCYSVQFLLFYFSPAICLKCYFFRFFFCFYSRERTLIPMHVTCLLSFPKKRKHEEFVLTTKLYLILIRFFSFHLNVRKKYNS